MEFQRLSVNINPETAAILRQVREECGWTTTECVRVAIGLLGYHESARRLEEKVNDSHLRSE